MYESMKVVEAVRAIVAENPDTIYTKLKCKYTEGKAGSGCGCLIGQAIVRAYPELKEELENIDKNLDPFADTLINEHIPFDETKAAQWLQHVQFGQDSRKRWSECVESADKTAPLPN